MDISWLGQACFKIKGKNVTLVIDPYDPQMLSFKLPKDLEAQILLVSHQHPDHNFTSGVSGNPLLIQGPGEYEKLGVSFVGINSFHDNKNGEDRGKNTIYHILMDNINLVHLGDLGHLLTDEQLDEIETTDILMIPVGGNYTIDGETAAKVVAQLEPKIIIPMHYLLPGMNLPIVGVETFLKEMGAEEVAPVAKLSITREKLPEESQVVVLSKS